MMDRKEYERIKALSLVQDFSQIDVAILISEIEPLITKIEELEEHKTELIMAMDKLIVERLNRSKND